MGSSLKPHGTMAAARRHQRAGEELCEPCRLAWREYREQRRETAPREPVKDGAGGERLSELEEVRQNLALVIVAMSSAPASAVAPLSRRREELDSRLRKLEDQQRTRDALAGRSGGVRESFDALMESAGIEL